MTRKQLVKALDKTTALVVKERDGWVCQRCGHTCKGQGAHWAHIFGRRKYFLRWDLLNSLTLCAGCHRWWHSESEGKVWFRYKFPVRWNYLHEPSYQPPHIYAMRCNATVKYTDYDLEIILEERKEKLKQLQKEKQNEMVTD